MRFVVALICFLAWKGSSSHKNVLPRAREYTSSRERIHFLARENTLPRARMKIFARCVANLRESSRETMYFIARSGELSRARLETSLLSRAKNRGYLGLSDESLEVGFGHPFGFCAFLVQNRFPNGFKIYRLSIS